MVLVLPFANLTQPSRRILIGFKGYKFLLIYIKMEIEYENEHVHQVYDKIATHFSDTRYKVS